MEHAIQFSPFTKESADQISELYVRHKERLEGYITQLEWWNERINLVSRSVPRETIRLHVKHSLCITALQGYQRASKIIDTGTGGGLPGLPLSVVSPKKRFLLNDIVTKKIMAVKQMAYKSGVKNVDTFTGSLAKCPVEKEDLLISKHAFKINELLSLINGKPWETIILMKGRDEAPNELSGINKLLDIQIIELENGFEDEFYKGKALVIIKKKNN